mmetsp:Transcript_4319/g.12077  ORF Transcript_4319/g.12077 Transcript_4319/m.12077 type:complete len:83 (+) Transcript_4319:3-251(+)
MVLRAAQELLVRRHSDLARVVLPAGVAFGFAYTMAYGTNPFADAWERWGGNRKGGGSEAARPGLAPSTYQYRFNLVTSGQRD